MEILHGVERVKNSVHSARRSRRSGFVPGILYGERLNNIMFEIGEMELDREIARGGEHGIISIDINGSDHKTLIKEVQRDPVSRKLLHIDLEEISSDKTIVSEVPITFSGEEMAGRNGGILQKGKDSVKVQCKAADLPKHIDVNLKNCKVGDVFRLYDLEIGSEITLMEDINSVVASITGGNTSAPLDPTDVENVPREIKK